MLLVAGTDLSRVNSTCTICFFFTHIVHSFFFSFIILDCYSNLNGG
jgi:hypothetical protein